MGTKVHRARLSSPVYIEELLVKRISELPEGVIFHEDIDLLVGKPEGIVTEPIVNTIWTLVLCCRLAARDRLHRGSVGRLRAPRRPTARQQEVAPGTYTRYLGWLYSLFDCKSGKGESLLVNRGPLPDDPLSGKTRKEPT